MVTIPASAAVPEGLTFTVGQITWTTRGGGLMTMVSEGTQIQSGITSAPTTWAMAPSARPPLPLYKGKKIDCSDLLQALDRADSKLLEASRLVDGILRQPDQAAPMDFFRSHWPTRVVTHERLGTSLTITSTPSGRSVKLKANPEEDYPCGLNNSASLYSRHIQSLFNKAGWLPKRNGRPARHYVNMVTIRELRDGKASSTNSSTGSVPTEVINSEDEDYDQDLPSHPPGFSRFPVFPPPSEETLFSTSAPMNRLLMEKQTSRGSSASSVTPIVPDDARMRNDKFRRIISATLLTWSGTSQFTRRQAPTWLLLWLI